MSRAPASRRDFGRLLGRDPLPGGPRLAPTVSRTVRQRPGKIGSAMSPAPAGERGQREWDPDNPTAGTGPGGGTLTTLTGQAFTDFQLEARLVVSSGEVDGWGLIAGGIRSGYSLGAASTGAALPLSLTGRGALAPTWACGVWVATDDLAAEWRCEWALSWWPAR